MIFRRPTHLLLTLVLAWGLGTPAVGQPSDWGSYKHPEHGYQIDIPYTIFAPVDDVEGRLTFESPDGHGRLTIYAEENIEGLTVAEIATELQNSSTIANVTYRKSGRSWVVLSGLFNSDIGEQVFYLKLMLSADRRKYAVFAINYPKIDKSKFDPVVERLEGTFRPPS
jgi:hypothetical protein